MTAESLYETCRSIEDTEFFSAAEGEVSILSDSIASELTIRSEITTTQEKLQESESESKTEITATPEKFREGESESETEITATPEKLQESETEGRQEDLDEAKETEAEGCGNASECSLTVTSLFVICS